MTATPMRYRKWIIASVVVAIGGAILILLRDELSLNRLAKHETELRNFQQARPLLVYGIAFVIYVIVTGLSLPGATLLTLSFGWFFGFLAGVPLVSFASTTGATVAFLLCRYLFRDAIQRRFGDRLTKMNATLQQEGPFYLFTVRLIPALPFFVVNAVMGLTPIRTRTYWWVSQLGMLPATVVYVFAGSSVPDLQTLADQGVNAVFTPRQMIQFGVAFALLGLFPLAARFGIRKIRG